PMTLPDRFIDHNTQDAQYREAGLDATAIAATALHALGLEQGTQPLLKATIGPKA
ncbi:hypothetical protein HLH27_11970, partial [Gluconacetobacter takamatsuzukensis]|nr:hypothetical protein [Gluconacetobacter takamatsuzukensis]